MKNSKYKKANRIALISIAVATLMACSSLTAFAASVASSSVDTTTTVIYTGNGTTQTIAVENADNLDAFNHLMPNGTTKPQDITIQNNSNKKMQVYFKAVPSGEEEISQKLLETLTLKITFKMDDSTSENLLYDGPASGKMTGNDIVTNQISMGYVYARSTTGKISATLTAPETMGNEFQDASAKINWVIQFELSGGGSNGGGGGGGGGDNSGTISTVSSQPTEIIGTHSTPQGGPTSSVAGETIVNGDIPLSKPPKTGDNQTLPWIILAVALVACLVFVVTRQKLKVDTRSKNG